MKRWLFKDAFGIDNLVQEDTADPVPRHGEVVLEMRAASLNYRDLVVMRGQHGRAVQPPLVPLSDGVGMVVDRAPETEHWQLGDRVIPAFFQGWSAGPPPANLSARGLGGPLDGVLTTRFRVPAHEIVRAPSHLTDAEVATLPCAGVTAWSALSEPSPVRAGETVLILGTGGVALFAAQLALAMGARVIMTTSGPARAALLHDMGVHLVIDRSETPDWAKAVRRATDGIGADRVLELGGAATLNSSIKAVRIGGTIALIGNVTGDDASLFLPLVLTRRVTMCSVTVGGQDALASLCRALELHRIHPIIDRVVPFDAAPSAFAALETEAPFGKICVAIEQIC